MLYMNKDNYIWQSDYQRAKIGDDFYIEEEHTRAKFRKDNIMYKDNAVFYFNDLKEDGSPEYKYEYPFSFVKNTESGEITVILNGYKWNMEALYEGGTGWVRVPLYIELHIFTTLHSNNMKVNILNQSIIPYSDYLIPFIYGLPIRFD